MNHNKPGLVDIVTVSVEMSTCPRCGAAPGSDCTTPSGRGSTSIHTQRTDPFHLLWLEGYRKALCDLAVEMDRHDADVDLPLWVTTFIDELAQVPA